jgi:hypothetical protein
LNPEYRNTVALRYSIGGYSVGATYTAVNNVIQSEFVQNDENHVTRVIQTNIGKRHQWGINGFAPFQFAKWYSLRIYAEATYAMVDTRYSGERFKNDYLSIYVGPQNVFTILSTLRANVQMMWMKPPWQGITQLDNVWNVDAQIEKSFFDNRLILTLLCSDIFNSVVNTGKLHFGNINQTIKENHHQRQIMLAARYSFGSQKIRGARNRRVGIEEEISRTK